MKYPNVKHCDLYFNEWKCTSTFISSFDQIHVHSQSMPHVIPFLLGHCCCCAQDSGSGKAGLPSVYQSAAPRSDGDVSTSQDGHRGENRRHEFCNFPP